MTTYHELGMGNCVGRGGYGVCGCVEQALRSKLVLRNIHLWDNPQNRSQNSPDPTYDTVDAGDSMRLNTM
jgi:hypothetical protein